MMKSRKSQQKQTVNMQKHDESSFACEFQEPYQS